MRCGFSETFLFPLFFFLLQIIIFFYLTLASGLGPGFLDPGSATPSQGVTTVFCLFPRQPPNDVEMALGGTLLPSISTFASGPAVKSKPIGIANSVSSMRSLSHEIPCQRGSSALGYICICHCVIMQCRDRARHHTVLGRAPVYTGWSSKLSASAESGGSTHGTV